MSIAMSHTARVASGLRAMRVFSALRFFLFNCFLSLPLFSLLLLPFHNPAQVKIILSDKHVVFTSVSHCSQHPQRATTTKS